MTPLPTAREIKRDLCAYALAHDRATGRGDYNVDAWDRMERKHEALLRMGRRLVRHRRQARQQRKETEGQLRLI